jgi:hypothetical protein
MLFRAALLGKEPTVIVLITLMLDGVAAALEARNEKLERAKSNEIEKIRRCFLDSFTNI